MPEAALRVQKQFWKPLDRAVRRARRPRTVELWQPPFRRPFRLRAEQRGTGLGGVRNPLGGVRSPFGERRRRSAADRLLSIWADSNGGLAFDFTDITATQAYGSGKIIDGATPANNWNTTSSLTPFDKLTWTGASLRMCYGSDGVLRYAPHNLQKHANDFSNAIWTTTDFNATTGQADPYGGSNATLLLTKNATTISTGLNVGSGADNGILTAGFNYRFFRRLKASSGNLFPWIELTTTNPTRRSWVNISTGAVGTVNHASVTSRSLGDGWWEFEVETGVQTSSSELYTTPRSADNTSIGITGDAVSGFYVVRAQTQALPCHSSEWIATTSSAVYKPRIDYNPSTLAVRGLLVEEARTNLALRSQEFGTTWSVASASVASDTTVSPDGTTTADTISFTATVAAQIYQAQTLTATSYTMSVFAKVASGTKTFRFKYYDGTTDNYSSDQTATTTWQRFTYTFTGVAASGNIALANGSAGAAGDVIFWGAQLEAGAFATSYIPTTSASVTRAADAVSLATSAFNLGSAWTLYAYADNSVATGQATLIVANDTTSNERTMIYTNGDPLAIATDGGANQAVLSLGAITLNTPFKAAAAFAANDFAAVRNGGTVQTDGAGTMPSPTRIQFGIENSTGVLNGHLRQVMHLPQRLANASLQTLTT